MNGTWALGGTASTTATAWGTIASNYANNGSYWTRIFPGSVQGNYWVVDTTGATCSIVGEARSGSNRGSITAVIIEDTSPPAPNGPPVWSANPLNRSNANEGVTYSSSLAADATDPDTGDTLTFTKISGPAWLDVSPNGALSGTPTAADVGANQWVIRVTDQGGLQADTVLAISVVAAPGPPTGLSATAGDAVVELTWNAVADASGYVVRRATVSGGPFTVLAAEVLTNHYTDGSVANGTTY
ncbi:MAG: hypothetical protein EOP83_31530, partial [Verrucomicrobiaceae bacterium]